MNSYVFSYNKALFMLVRKFVSLYRFVLCSHEDLASDVLTNTST